MGYPMEIDVSGIAFAENEERILPLKTALKIALCYWHKIGKHS